MNSPYTVILKLPDYLQSDFGTVVHHCRALDAESGGCRAQRDLAGCYPDSSPEDFALIAVFAGHQFDIQGTGNLL